MSVPVPRLLGADEPPAYTLERGDGASRFVLICDHASRRLPAALGDLGVSAADLERHVAWDVGALGVARALSRHLDAPLIAQNWSRLVIDCNRPPGSATSIVTRSEDVDVPGNRNLAPEHVALREREIFAPYHARIAAELDRRAQAGRPAVLISVHSFTPVFAGVARPWHLGLLYRHDARVAAALLPMMRETRRWSVGDNEPYAVGEGTDYAIPVHGERRGLPHVGLEVRQDLVDAADGQAEWAERIAGWLQRLPDFAGG
jgi:predicted N-formylglutamate amidohydrolase